MKESKWRKWASSMRPYRKLLFISMSTSNHSKPWLISWSIKPWKWKIGKLWLKWNYKEMKWCHHLWTTPYSWGICHSKINLDQELWQKSPYLCRQYTNQVRINRLKLTSVWSLRCQSLRWETCRGRRHWNHTFMNWVNKSMAKSPMTSSSTTSKFNSNKVVMRQLHEHKVRSSGR